MPPTIPAGAMQRTAPESPTRLQQAIAHHSAGQRFEAAAIYRELLAANPADADALCLSGVLAHEDARHEEALDLMRRALALQPDNASIAHTLANTLRELKQFPESAVVYAQVMHLTPNNQVDQVARFNFASVLQQLRKFADAIDCYGHILRLDPRSAQAYNDMGAAHIAIKQYDQAAVCIKNALALNPDYAEAHNNQGVIYRSQRRLDDAIASYQEALRCKPDDARALFNLGTIYLIRKEYARAIPFYRQSLACNPDQYDAHQNLACILQEQGKLEEAQWHRDCAFQAEHLFFDTIENPQKTVVILWAAGAGNVPIDTLWPTQRYSRVCCLMDYVSDAEMRTLPDYDVVFNAIGDRDATDATDAAVRRFQSVCSKPFMNTPDAVQRTARDHILALFSAVDHVVCATTLRCATVRFKQSVLECGPLQFPIIVRPGGSHGGRHLVKLNTPEELQTLNLYPAPVYYASNYVDYRSADGYFRKYRMVFVNREALPYHLAIGSHWIVHYETAHMKFAEWKLEEERAFLENPRQVLGDRAMEAVAQIGRTLDLDYGGVDFSLLADGRVLVFEANATMLVHDEALTSALRHKRPYVQKIFDAFRAHVDRVTAPSKGE